MNILAIDSSSKPASAAVVCDNHILSEVFVNNGLTHSRTLMNVVESALRLAEKSVDDIDLIACTVGPGSFTGVRIGVACAKGIAFPKNIKCVGISTLQTFAYNMSCIEGYVCGIMDARCAQVYTSVFKLNGGKVERINEDNAQSIDSLVAELEKLEGNVYLLGDGAHLVKAKTDKSSIILANESVRYQRASSAAYVALSLDENAYIAPDELVPVYLRLPQAQRELKNKQKGSDNL